MSRVARVVLSLVVALAGAACTPALTDVKPALTASDSGRIVFATAGTLNRTGSRLVPGDPVALSGTLKLPAAEGRVPAVILMHGCGGVGNAESGWVAPLNAAGYATFVVDSFTGRGLTEVCTSGITLTSIQRIPDAYGALRLLATHPRIDAGRVALMGFSHGGGLTLAASTKWAKDAYASGARAAFRAFLPFYPGCTGRYPELRVLSAPLRIHSGEADDWTPAAPCVALVDELKAAGQDAEIYVYPGALHSFDNVGRPVTRLPNVDNGSGCRMRGASILGPVLNLAENAHCLTKGATLGWSPSATEAARRNVRTQLAILLR